MNSQDLLNIVTALGTAKQMEFMSREHASAIWKQVLKTSGLDVPKQKTVEKVSVAEVPVKTPKTGK